MTEDHFSALSFSGVADIADEPKDLLKGEPSLISPKRLQMYITETVGLRPSKSPSFRQLREPWRSGEGFIVSNYNPRRYRHCFLCIYF